MSLPPASQAVRWTVHHYVDASALPKILVGAPPLAALCNHGDGERIGARITETDNEDELFAEGVIDGREYDDREMMIVGEVTWPEGVIALPGVPIMRDPVTGQQIPMMVFAKLVLQPGTDKIGVDCNGFPVFRFYTIGIDHRSNALPHAMLKIAGSNSWVRAINIFAVNLIDGPTSGDAQALYKSVYTSFFEVEWFGGGM
jgi:hypothetical protein